MNVVAGTVGAIAAAAGGALGFRALVRSSKSNAYKWGRKYVEGGFRSEMDRAEAAKILGVRETACKEQVEDRYRSLMRFNHPDLGGSPFLSTKVNEAKEMLLPRARSDPAWVRTQKRRKEARDAREERRVAREKLAADNAEMEASRAKVAADKAKNAAADEGAK